MSNTTTIPLTGTLSGPLLDRRSVSRPELTLAWVVAAIAGALLIAALLFLSAGGRWFVVETPSMGEAAPVGTLVMDMPVRTAALHVGDIISFQVAAAPETTYTHRIIDIDATGGIHTRGDINGATDPWTLTQENIVGSPVLLIPYLGWLFRAAPILLIGTLLIWILTSPFTDRVTRSSLRVAGASLTASYAAFILKPFVNVTMITNTATPNAVHATVVSSGMFPVRVEARGGTIAHLVDGEVGRITIRELNRHGSYQLASNIDLDVFGWALLIGTCLIPLVWCLAIGRLQMVRTA
jgi:signal peptidase I